MVPTPDEPEDDARPGLAPPDPPAREVATLHVEGETFVVRERDEERPGRRTYSYDWVSGPNPGYGFSSSGPFVPAEDEHVEAVRAFLAEIDPETGYLPD